MILLDKLVILALPKPIGPVTLTLPTGGYAILTGPTGFGKTSILEAVVGLRKILSGKGNVGNHDLTAATPAARNIGYVPQDAALFTHLSVAENIGFALMLRTVPRPAIQARVHELAAELELTSLLTRSARGLSGGEAQRVALARAVAHRPPVLLLDEPFSALDTKTRRLMAAAVSRWHAADRFTAIHVTHTPDEINSTLQIKITELVGSDSLREEC